MLCMFQVTVTLVVTDQFTVIDHNGIGNVTKKLTVNNILLFNVIFSNIQCRIHVW